VIEGFRVAGKPAFSAWHAGCATRSQKPPSVRPDPPARLLFWQRAAANEIRRPRAVLQSRARPTFLANVGT
jgi:hypothetical protein